MSHSYYEATRCKSKEKSLKTLHFETMPSIVDLMDVYTELLKILAGPATLFFGWWLKTTWDAQKSEIKHLKAEITAVKKSVLVTEKTVLLYGSDLSSILKSIEKIEQTNERYGQAMVMLKTDLVRVETKFEEVETLKENYGKIIMVLDKVVKRRSGD